MKQNPNHGTGVRKTILGLECEVWKSPFDPNGAICLSLGGSFVSYGATGEQIHLSMALEMTSPYGSKMHATEAKLDAMVNSAVFAPYLAGGFTITRTGTRK